MKYEEEEGAKETAHKKAIEMQGNGLKEKRVEGSVLSSAWAFNQQKNELTDIVNLQHTNPQNAKTQVKALVRSSEQTKKERQKNRTCMKSQILDQK